MLRIAVCDDEEKQLHEITRLLEAYFRSRPSLNGQVETFLSSSGLLERAGSLGGFDLYILDILMPELTGIETGRRLRALGDGGEIIYLTCSNDFAADSYDVRAFSRDRRGYCRTVQDEWVIAEEPDHNSYVVWDFRCRRMADRYDRNIWIREVLL